MPSSVRAAMRGVVGVGAERTRASTRLEAASRLKTGTSSSASMGVTTMSISCWASRSQMPERNSEVCGPKCSERWRGRGDTDGAGAAGGEAPGASIGPVAEAAARLRRRGPGLLVDFRIAIEGAAHGGLREPQLVRQVFEFHNQIPSHPRLPWCSFGGCLLPELPIQSDLESLCNRFE